MERLITLALRTHTFWVLLPLLAYPLACLVAFWFALLALGPLELRDFISFCREKKTPCLDLPRQYRSSWSCVVRPPPRTVTSELRDHLSRIFVATIVVSPLFVVVFSGLEIIGDIAIFGYKMLMQDAASHLTGHENEWPWLGGLPLWSCYHIAYKLTPPPLHFMMDTVGGWSAFMLEGIERRLIG